MIVHSPHKEIKEPIGYVCDICGKAIELDNSYQKMYDNTVESQMGIVRVLQPDGSPAGEEIHVCSMDCAGKVVRRYNMKIQILIPSMGHFDRSRKDNKPEESGETFTSVLSGLAKNKITGTDEQYRKLGKKIFDYISWAGADPVKLITLAAVLMSFDKDMERGKEK